MGVAAVVEEGVVVVARVEEHVVLARVEVEFELEVVEVVLSRVEMELEVEVVEVVEVEVEVVEVQVAENAGPRVHPAE